MTKASRLNMYMMQTVTLAWISTEREQNRTEQNSAMCHDVGRCIFSKEKDNIFRVFDPGMDHWDSLGRLSEAFPMSTEGLYVDNLRKQ